MKIAIIDTFHGALREALEEQGYICDDLSMEQATVLPAILKTYDGILIRSKLSIGPAEIDQWPDLKFIGRVGAGLEHIDVAYARSKGVEVFSSPEGNRQAVAEHALGMLLSLMNRLPRANREVRQGQWRRKENEGTEIQGKTIAAIGYGNTGSAFCKLFSGFGARVMAYDKYKTGFGTELVEEVEMEEIFQSADVVSIHLPMTDETDYLVNSDWLSRFQKPIYLINTSRGGIVNTEALLDALDDGTLSGAGLDVLEFETNNLKMPALAELPGTAQRLFDHPGVVLTPHTAGLTAESYRKLSTIMAEKIISHFDPA